MSLPRPLLGTNACFACWQHGLATPPLRADGAGGREALRALEDPAPYRIKTSREGA